MSDRRQFHGCVLDYRPETGVVDQSHYENDGTYDGGMGVAGGEFVFDGGDDYINAGSPASLNFGANSFSFVVRFKTTATGSLALLGKGLSGTAPLALMWLQNGSLRAGIEDGSGNTSDTAIDGGTWNDGNWHTGAVVFDRDQDTLTRYIDGTPIGAVLDISGITDSVDTTAPLTVGSHNNGSTWLYDGNLSSVQVFKTALTPGQIANLASDPDYEPFGNLGGEVVSLQPQRYKGSGNLIDESGNGNDAAVIGAAVAATIDFDGVDDYLTIPHQDNLNFANGEMSFSAFIKPRTWGFSVSGSEYGRLFRKGLAYDLRLEDSGGAKVVKLSFGTGTTVSWPEPIVLNVWQHFALTIDGTDAELWVNGVSQGTRSINAPSTNTDELFIGNYDDSIARYFEGEMTDIRLFNRAVTEAGVKFLHSKGIPGVEVPNTRGAVAAYSPSYDDAGNGTTTLLDYSGFARHGTLTNMDPATDWVDDTGEGGLVALDFDGADDYVSIAMSNGTEYTISAWALPHTSAPSTQAVLGIAASVGASNIVYLRWRNGRWYHGINALFAAGQAGVVGEWQHIVLTRGTSGAYLYVNGVQTTATTEVPSASSVLVIGDSARRNSPFDGLVDDVLIFPRAATPSDIAVLSESRNAFAATPAPATPFTNQPRRRIAGVPGL